MPRFEFREEFPRRLNPTFSYVFKALANAFLGVCLGGDIEQPLIGRCVLDDGRGFPFDRQYNGTLALFELFEKFR